MISLQISEDRWLLVAFDGAGWRFYGWRDSRGAELEEPSLSRCDRERYFDAPGAASEHFRLPNGSDQQVIAARRGLRLAG